MLSYTHYVTVSREREDSVGNYLNPLTNSPIDRIPFRFVIKLPLPLKTGKDYGFLPGSNISKPRPTK